MTRLSSFRLLLAFLALFAMWPAHAAYTDNNDGTVTDSVTGLMWDKCTWGGASNTDCSGGSITAHTWTQALSVSVTANAMNSGAGYKGYSDWRLPNVNELESLVKIDASGSAIDHAVFPGTICTFYWTATTVAAIPASAWGIVFGSGGYLGDYAKANFMCVRLVRSGQSFAAFDRFADLAAPAYQSTALDAGRTVATLTFDEALLNNLADLAALKAAVTFAADGTNFAALAAGDTVAISGSTLVVTFATPLTGSTNKLKLAANSLKDDHGNVLASAVTTAAIDVTAPSYQNAALNANQTVATLTFDKALTNNLADLAALKAAVTFAADGTTFAALATGDTVAISGSTLTITFATPLTGTNNTLKLAANSLKNAFGNVLSSAVTTAALDAAPPAYQSFVFHASNTLASLNFNEALVNNLADLAALKAAITFAADGTNFAPLPSYASVYLSGSTLAVNFGRVISGAANKLKLAAGSLRDASGNVLNVVTTIALDAAPPAFQGAALNADLTVATLNFDETLVLYGINLSGLKRAIEFAADGSNFVALAAGDTVALSGSTLTVTFAAPLSGNTNKLKLASWSLMDAYNNLLTSTVTTAALDAVDSVPDAFSFGSLSNAAVQAAAESAAITVTGINAASAISIVGGQYAVSTDNGTTWSAYTSNAGTVSRNDRVKVKLTSSSAYSTVATATLTIGGVSGAFSVTTQAMPATNAPPAPTQVNLAPGGTTTLGSLPVISQGGATVTVPKDSGGGKITLNNGGSATSLVLGDAKLSVTPLGGAANFSVQTATYQGKPVLVIQITSGSASFTAPAGMPFMVLNGGTVSAGGKGAEVTGDAGKLVIRSGSVTLSADGNSFAAEATITAYAGEVIEKDAQGKLRIRVGSSSGSDGAVGDPLKPVDGLPAAVNLNGKLGRLNDTSPLDMLAAAYAQTNVTQNPDGSLGAMFHAVPVAIRIDAARADGVQGLEVARNGLVVKLVPLLGDPVAFAAQIGQGASVAMDSNGVLNLTSQGRQYAGRAAVVATPVNAPAANGFSADAQGNLVWTHAGKAQVVYPAFQQLDKLHAALLGIDPKATLTDNGDGSYSVTLKGQRYRFRPDYELLNVLTFPAAHRNESWWVDGGKVYLNHGNVTAQGFTVR